MDLHDPLATIALRAAVINVGCLAIPDAPALQAAGESVVCDQESPGTRHGGTLLSPEPHAGPVVGGNVSTVEQSWTMAPQEFGEVFIWMAIAWPSAFIGIGLASALIRPPQKQSGCHPVELVCSLAQSGAQAGLTVDVRGRIELGGTTGCHPTYLLQDGVVLENGWAASMDRPFVQRLHLSDCVDGAHPAWQRSTFDSRGLIHAVQFAPKSDRAVVLARIRPELGTDDEAA